MIMEAQQQGLDMSDLLAKDCLQEGDSRPVMLFCNGKLDPDFQTSAWQIAVQSSEHQTGPSGEITINKM